MIVLDDCKEYDVTPEEADKKCRRGVQLIVQTVMGVDGPRREVLRNFEYYFYDDINKRWRGTHSLPEASRYHEMGQPMLYSSMMDDAKWFSLEGKYLTNK